ncbi:MAG: hypothetical protein ACRCT2_00065 [Plesiomonas shigelloides]
MASFRDYQASKTARVELFHGEYLNVRQVSSESFADKGLPYYREKLDLSAAGKLDNETAQKLDYSMSFALIESWSFEDELTLDNFLAMLTCDELFENAMDTIREIDRVASDRNEFVKKKSQSSLTGLNENGSLIDQPETAESKPDDKA